MPGFWLRPWQEVHDTVIRSFKDLGVTSFRFLVASKDNSMALTEKQTMCGDSLLEVVVFNYKSYVKHLMKALIQIKKYCSTA